MKKFENNTVFITGGPSGIGKACITGTCFEIDGGYLAVQMRTMAE